MKNKNKVIGQIVALNSGDISDCYTSGDIKDKPRLEHKEQLFDVVQPADAKSVTIGTADELFEFARKLNGGDPEMRGAFVKLQNDIDLGRREWGNTRK